MAARAKIPDLILPPVNPIRKWATSPENTFDKWRRKADKASTDAENRALMRKAYVCDDGFYHYVQEFILDRPAYEPFHGRMARRIVGADIERYPVKQAWGVVGFRGSWKSHYTIGNACWLADREFVLSEWTREKRAAIQLLLDEGVPADDPRIKALETEIEKAIAAGEAMEGVNIRFAFQSEAKDHAEKNLQTAIDLLETPKHVKAFCSHQGEKWARGGATSKWRTRPLKDATFFPISLKQPEIGSHPDVIGSDDFQSENTVGSGVYRERSWSMFKANYQLLPPPTMSFYSYIVVTGTRWHSADNIGRIERENEQKAKRDRVELLIMPVCDAAGTPSCPTIYDREAIKSLQAEGTDKYNNQYLLKPIGGKTQPFQPEDVRNYHTSNWSERERKIMFAVTAADFCWLEAERRGSSGDDHCCVGTALVDQFWRFYIVDWYQEQVTRDVGLRVMARQILKHGSRVQGFSTADRASIEPIMNQLEFEVNKERHLKQLDYLEGLQLPVDFTFSFAPTWVSDLKGGEGVDAAAAKHRKVIGTLQGPVHRKKIFFLPGLVRLEQEMLDFPRGTTDDGPDVLAMIVIAAGAPPAVAEEKPLEEEGPLTMGKFYEGIVTGKPVDFDGRPLRDFERPNRTRRRPRSRIPMP